MGRILGWSLLIAGVAIIAAPFVYFIVGMSAWLVAAR